MARYIDLDKVEFIKVDGNEEFNHGVDCCINKLLETEPACVIEHYKVDKAIEEIEGEYSTCNQDWIDGLNRALEILKRNIGE